MSKSSENSDAAKFSDWLAEFEQSAFALFESDPLIGECLESLRFEPSVLAKYGSQAEFTRSMGEYVGIAASEARAEKGRAMQVLHRRALQEIEDSYGVEASILTAIWGVETDYGARMGGFRVMDSLATLAGCGVRTEFFEAELRAAMRIVLSGASGIPELKGSWAGAMGHTQFMPTSYLNFAVSLQDGRQPDIWGENPADALASAANYLASHGWRKSVRWAEEVVLPRRFDYALAGEENWMAAEEWLAAGVRFAGNPPFPQFSPASLLLPAGKEGPALLVSENFEALRSYNRAVAYAIAVGQLSERIAGKGGIGSEWPPADHHLSRQEIKELQSALTAQGYDTGGIDGLAGPATRASIRDCQKKFGLAPDGFPGREIYKLLCV